MSTRFCRLHAAAPGVALLIFSAAGSFAANAIPNAPTVPPAPYYDGARCKTDGYQPHVALLCQAWDRLNGKPVRRTPIRRVLCASDAFAPLSA